MSTNGSSVSSNVLLLALHTPDQTDFEVNESLEELGDLAASLGGRVVGQLVQQRVKPNPGTLFGAGKIDEIRMLVQRTEAEVAIYDGLLSPSQGQALERTLKIMVIDRTQLILDIFHRNARSRESRLQVELAQLEYMLPRLVGMWAHLDRERGGISGSKGAGEKQVDIDRSLIRNRIARLKRDLATLSRERNTQKKRRANCFRVTLVGYTNAGKSTLLNRLTDSQVLAENRLFATLDPTTRVLLRENRPHVLLSDTVGFIRRLPHQLVASFHSTLEVARDADLLLHVVDISHPAYEHHVETTHQVLEDIGAGAVPWLMVFNKIDQIEDPLELMLARKRYPDALFVSAATDECEGVKARVVSFFEKVMVTTPLKLDYASYGELSKIYRWSRVDEVRYEQDGIHLTVTSTPANLERIRAAVHVTEDLSLMEDPTQMELLP